MGLWRDRKRREHKPGRIGQRAQNDSFPVANFLRNRAKNRLPNPPGQVLNRNRQRELAAQPAELLSDWNLKHPKTLPNGKAHQNDDTPDDQDGGKQRSIAVHDGSPAQAWRGYRMSGEGQIRILAVINKKY